MVNNIAGLAVKTPWFPCRKCGGMHSTVGGGELICGCGGHIGWVSKQTGAFLAEVVRQFGRPTEPVEIRPPNTWDAA